MHAVDAIISDHQIIPEGSLTAWHFSQRRPVTLTWSEGILRSMEPSEQEPAQPIWVAPSLFDPQVNGYCGVDFQGDYLDVADLLKASKGLLQAGCSRFFLTLISDHWDSLLKRLAHIKSLRDSNQTLKRSIVGWHLEGPFLSAEPGFRGAHPAEVMRDPSPEDMDALKGVVGSDPLLLTLAPERSGSLEAIARAVKLGFTVSLGHTNASAETLRLAQEAGATGFTHLGNGCPQELDRHDNILWRVFGLSNIRVGIIPDGIHLSPALMQLIHRLIDTRCLYATSDAMAAAGGPPGIYSMGRLKVEVGSDQVVRMPGRSNFAGSALRPLQGIFRAAGMLGLSWQAVWPWFSDHPAHWLGIPSGMEPGHPLHLCRLDYDPSFNLKSVSVITGQ